MTRCHRYSVNSRWVPGELDPPPQVSPSPPVESLALLVMESVPVVVLLVKGQLEPMLARRLVLVPIPRPVLVPGVIQMV